MSSNVSKFKFLRNLLNCIVSTFKPHASSSLPPSSLLSPSDQTQANIRRSWSKGEPIQIPSFCSLRTLHHNSRGPRHTTLPWRLRWGFSCWDNWQGNESRGQAYQIKIPIKPIPINSNQIKIPIKPIPIKPIPINSNEIKIPIKPITIKIPIQIE